MPKILKDLINFFIRWLSFIPGFNSSRKVEVLLRLNLPVQKTNLRTLDDLFEKSKLTLLHAFRLLRNRKRTVVEIQYCTTEENHESIRRKVQSDHEITVLSLESKPL